jgi:hypothetical protein
VWHFAFHGARDVAEMLEAGRERPYLQAFFAARTAAKRHDELTVAALADAVLTFASR